jgi:hypothetical protein
MKFAGFKNSFLVKSSKKNQRFFEKKLKIPKISPTIALEKPIYKVELLLSGDSPDQD